MDRKHFGFTRYPFDQPLEPAELFASTAITEAQARLKHLIELRGIGVPQARKHAAQRVVPRLLRAALHRQRDGYVPVHRLGARGCPPSATAPPPIGSSARDATRLTLEAKQRPLLIVDEAQPPQK